MIINIAIFVSENFSVAKHWLLCRRRMHLPMNRCDFFFTCAIIHKPFSFFLHWNFHSKNFFPFRICLLCFFYVVKCLRAAPKSRCWSQVYAITLTLQNTRVACNCNCKRKLTQLCANIFLMCKFGAEPLKNDTAAITLHTHTEWESACNADSWRWVCILLHASERKKNNDCDWFIAAMPQAHTCDHIYFLTFIEECNYFHLRAE